MGQWFLDRSAYYSGDNRNWPYPESVPRTIAQYEFDTQDYAFTWPGPGCNEYVFGPFHPFLAFREQLS